MILTFDINNESVLCPFGVPASLGEIDINSFTLLNALDELKSLSELDLASVKVVKNRIIIRKK